jgi:hypothetical protein
MTKGITVMMMRGMKRFMIYEKLKQRKTHPALLTSTSILPHISIAFCAQALIISSEAVTSSSRT